MQWTRHALEYDGWIRAVALIAHGFLAVMVVINTILATLNLLPIPPLDGSKIWPCLMPNVKPAFQPKTNLFFLVVFLVLIFSHSLNPLMDFTIHGVMQWAPQLETTPFLELSNAGNRALKEKQWRKAEDCYTEALQLQPNSAECYFARSIALLQQWKLKAALRDIDRAIQIRPTEIFPYSDYVVRALGQPKDLENETRPFDDRQPRECYPSGGYLRPR